MDDQINHKREKEEEMELYRNRIIYSLPVHAGYWTNELAIREQGEILYSYKKDRCQLLIQKTRKMYRNLLKTTALYPESSYINFNKNYQIKSYGIASMSACGAETIMPLYLSGCITDREIDNTQHFVHGCALSASPHQNPCVRNTFLLKSCDPDSTQAGPVRYGEDIYFEIVDSGGYPLYIQCENSTIDTFGSNLSLRLSQSADIYCRFKLVHWEPQLRYETMATLVVYATPVVIQHVASGRNLAAEFNNWMPTFFGPECTVSCTTFKDPHRVETSENLWRIVGEERTNKI